MITIDYKSRVPIYDQIVAGVIRLKALGVLNAGDKMPSVRSLALELSVNPNTVQKAYAILENDGVICSVSGKGSFISEDDSSESAIKTSIKKSFISAAQDAVRTGIKKEELLEIIDDLFKKEVHYD